MRVRHICFIGFLLLVATITVVQAQSRYTVLHQFEEAQGERPYGHVIIEQDVMYGMTRYGGTNDDGVIYSMGVDGSAYTVLYDFSDNEQGRNPYGSVVMFSNVLYGMTYYGGTNNQGAIFSINPDGSDYTKLHDFGATPDDGRRPRGSLMAYQDQLFGMTSDGGTNDEGTIFSYNPVSMVYTILHQLGNSDGEYPYGDLLAENGRLYGMTHYGGEDGRGVVFSMNPDGSDYAILHNFGSMEGDGERPYGSLISDGSRLYGLTSSGGTSTYFYYYSAGGTVFGIDPDGSDYEKLHDFEWMSDGFMPYGSLVADGSRLFGTTPYGGGMGYWGYYGGCIFSLESDGTAYNAIHRFSPDKMEQGVTPRASLTLYEDAFYGVTTYGGSNDDGVIYKFVSRFASLNDFDGDGRADPDVFWPYAGMWYIDQSTDGPMTRQWGWNEAQPFTGDFDGDGRYDTAFYWPQEGMWYIWKSEEGIAVVQWGWRDAVPVPGDYNGDLRTDIAVYDPMGGTWYIWLSGSEQLRIQNWGWSETVPVPGDFDGDDKTDLAVYWPQGGNWYILYSDGGGLIRNWGWSETVPVPGDYDGDQKTELGVYAPQDSTWSILYSTGGSCITNFGTSTCIPVPADYDGDRITDLAVFEAEQGLWTIFNSDNGTVTTHQLGDAETPPALPQYWINKWFGWTP